MNILILSVGTRNKIIQYMKKALCGEGIVVAADMSLLAPAIYEADKFYQLPRITDPGYIQKVLEICHDEKIQGVFSLIDPELSLLAKNAERFAEQGVTVIGSLYELCERSLDKWEMYKWLSRHNYPCAKSFSDKEAFYHEVKSGALGYPAIVKPMRGSASIAVSKVEECKMIEYLFSQNEDMMIQEFLHGQEIGADVYIDMISHEVVSIFTKRKLLMRAGETDKAVSFKNDALFSFIERFVKEFGFTGPIDIDLFEIDGEYYISEVNPRFGGGYPHAYACGCDHMSLIVNNLKGLRNQRKIGQYDENIFMMKYNEIAIKVGE